jgi:hypothetical protein
MTTSASSRVGTHATWGRRIVGDIMTGAEIAGAVALDALKVALFAGLKQVASAAKATVADWNLEIAANHLVAVAMIRPIWNPSTEVDLISLHFPCPVRLRGKLIRPTDLDSFDGNRIVITGNVGQGKSILLRFLARQETLAKRVLEAEVMSGSAAFPSRQNPAGYHWASAAT